LADLEEPGADGLRKQVLGDLPRERCEVANVDEGIGLSDAVANAVPDTVRTVEDVLSDLLSRTSVREG